MWYILAWDRRPLVPALCSVAVLALVLAGCSNNSPNNPSNNPPAAKAGTAAPAASASGGQDGTGHPEVIPIKPAEVNQDVVPREGPIPFEPPDGKWLTDEYGRKYFVTKIKKLPQSWVWVEEGKRVQLAYGLQFDVVSHDETSFDVKIYGLDAKTAAGIEEKRRRRQPSPEDLAKAAATYQPSTAASDRLVFTPFSQGLPQRGQWRNGFAVVDINEDGKLDIVHGPPRKGGSTPVIFLGDGKGTWRRWAEAAFPPIPFDYGDVAVADFNGDGHPDLAVASHLRGITVLVGDGKGRFTPWSQGIEFEAGDQSTPIFSSRAIEVVDWNGDGRTDLLALGEGPRLAAARVQGAAGFSRGSRGAVVYLNKGDGTWEKKAPTKEEFGYGDGLAVADFNQDGRPDFAAASAVNASRTILYLNQEDGSWQNVSTEQVRPAAVFRGIAAGDFDGDGRMDLAVGYVNDELGVTRTGIDVLFARPDGAWDRRPLAVQEDRAAIWALDTGDLDGDGALDLVGLTGTGDTWVFLGNGKGSFTREQSPELGAPDAAGCTGYHVSLTDLDGDGAAELIAGYAGENTVTLGGAVAKCSSGGRLQAWKASRQGRR